MYKFFQYLSRFIYLYSSVIADSPTGDNTEPGLSLEQTLQPQKQVTQDSTDILQELILSASDGDAQAQRNLGSIYLDRAMSASDVVSSKKELAQANYWFHKSTDGTTENLNPPDTSKIVQMCFLEAEQGSNLAQITLGLSYLHGSGVEQDFSKARFWLQKSAQSGDVYAQIHLGHLYHQKKYGFQDTRLAIEWFEKAAAQEHDAARHILGVIYLEGQGVPKDLVKAKQWLLLAAQQGFARSQYCLGDMYCYGDGVPENHQEALKWYLKSANQGLASAQCAVGMYYAYGKGGQLQDVVQATKWFRLAAAQKDATALNNLSLHYGAGLGVPLNRVASYALYRLALLLGMDSNADMELPLAAFAAILTPKQIQLADTLVEQLSKSDNLLQTLDDYISKHTEKDAALKNNNEYIEGASRMLSGHTQLPVNLPTNILPAKLNRSQRRAKLKKR